MNLGIRESVDPSEYESWWLLRLDLWFCLSMEGTFAAGTVCVGMCGRLGKVGYLCSVEPGLVRVFCLRIFDTRIFIVIGVFFFLLGINRFFFFFEGF